MDDEAPSSGSSPRERRQGRLAHLGFSNIWAFPEQTSAYDEVKIYTITDRPVYRPGSPVRFKFWVGTGALRSTGRKSEFAGKTFTVEIRNPKGDKVFSRQFTADAFGGFDGSFELPSDATLGPYQIFTPNLGGGSFRVEEYKKPEFEVKVDAPTAPVMLGEKVSATIKANYYFGGPGYRGQGQVQDHPHTRRRALVSRRSLGLAFRPGLLVVRRRFVVVSRLVALGNDEARALLVGTSVSAPPEVVAEANVPIRPDGTLAVEIDTALAKAAHPDQDQRYEITAEITDQSRRHDRGNRDGARRARSRSACIPGSIAVITASATRSRRA